MYPDKNRAKRIILEIIRQAGGEIGRTKLYKAFWLAHMYYDRDAVGFLSDWPVVKMPNGHGIDKGPRLLGELEEEGAVENRKVPKGVFNEFVCVLRSNDLGEELDSAAVKAIKEAVEFVMPLTTEQLSCYAHDNSRSWNKAADGDELNIYLDPLEQEEFEERKREAARLKAELDELV